MRILITGGAGFQGSHLAEFWLDSGHEVTILNTYSQEAFGNISSFAGRVEIVWGSVTDPEIVQKTLRDHDVVVHMAARVSVDESIEDPSSVLNVNILGTWNVLDAARKWGARVIYGSSCEVYGWAQAGLAKEDCELRPHSPYAASKAAADRLCFAYHKTYGVDATIVRPCNIYGQRQRFGVGGAVIPIFLDNAARDKPITIFGDGSQGREYLNVEDVVAAYDLVLRHSDLAGETINFGSGEVISIKEIAEFIASNVDGTIVYAPGRPGEVHGFRLDSDKARGLGFAPKVTFWEGLTKYIHWRQQLNATS